LIKPGTGLNKKWNQSLGRVAEALDDLQKSGVVVLWRPFHEMNGGWFWWSRQSDPKGGNKKFKALWRYMFDYFTKKKKLNNLLWVYGVSGAAETASDKKSRKNRSIDYFFPGKNVVDIVGVDYYSDKVLMPGYKKLLKTGKPIAITEVGPKTTNGLS
jgi:mannan endo-1,4-beta-mannosidase